MFFSPRHCFLCRYDVELSPVVVSTTMVPNSIDNLLTLDMSTSSKTPNTEEASLFKKPFVLKEEPTSEDAVLMKKSLSSKKCTNPGVMSLLQKPLSLQGKSDSDVVQPMTFGKKCKTEEAAITNRTLSIKMCANIRESSPAQGRSWLCRMSVLKRILPLWSSRMLGRSLKLRKQPPPTHYHL